MYVPSKRQLVGDFQIKNKNSPSLKLDISVLAHKMALNKSEIELRRNQRMMICTSIVYIPYKLVVLY